MTREPVNMGGIRNLNPGEQDTAASVDRMRDSFDARSNLEPFMTGFAEVMVVVVVVAMLMVKKKNRS